MNASATCVMSDTRCLAGTALCCLQGRERSSRARRIGLTNPVRYIIYLLLAIGARDKSAVKDCLSIL